MSIYAVLGPLALMAGILLIAGSIAAVLHGCRRGWGLAAAFNYLEQRPAGLLAMYLATAALVYGLPLAAMVAVMKLLSAP